MQLLASSRPSDCLHVLRFAFIVRLVVSQYQQIETLVQFYRVNLCCRLGGVIKVFIKNHQELYKVFDV